MTHYPEPVRRLPLRTAPAPALTGRRPERIPFERVYPGLDRRAVARLVAEMIG